MCFQMWLLVSSEEVPWWLVVQRELAGAVAGHADPHEAEQDGHTRRGRTLAALQYSLSCLSLKDKQLISTFILKVLLETWLWPHTCLIPARVFPYGKSLAKISIFVKFELIVNQPMVNSLFQSSQDLKSS